MIVFLSFHQLYVNGIALHKKTFHGRYNYEKNQGER